MFVEAEENARAVLRTAPAGDSKDSRCTVASQNAPARHGFGSPAGRAYSVGRGLGILDDLHQINLKNQILTRKRVVGIEFHAGFGYLRDPHGNCRSILIADLQVHACFGLDALARPIRNSDRVNPGRVAPWINGGRDYRQSMVAMDACKPRRARVPISHGFSKVSSFDQIVDPFAGIILLLCHARAAFFISAGSDSSRPPALVGAHRFESISRLFTAEE